MQLEGGVIEDSAGGVVFDALSSASRSLRHSVVSRMVVP
jgi:hypothetical protein